jgi:hypothetical protein
MGMFGRPGESVLDKVVQQLLVELRDVNSVDIFRINMASVIFFRDSVPVFAKFSEEAALRFERCGRIRRYRLEQWTMGANNFRIFCDQRRVFRYVRVRDNSPRLSNLSF